jgi:hypothetical protein
LVGIDLVLGRWDRAGVCREWFVRIPTVRSLLLLGLLGLLRLLGLRSWGLKVSLKSRFRLGWRRGWIGGLHIL